MQVGYGRRQVGKQRARALLLHRRLLLPLVLHEEGQELQVQCLYGVAASWMGVRSKMGGGVVRHLHWQSHSCGAAAAVADEEEG
jgi:hypothetical protein